MLHVHNCVTGVSMGVRVISTFSDCCLADEEALYCGYFGSTVSHVTLRDKPVCTSKPIPQKCNFFCLFPLNWDQLNEIVYHEQNVGTMNKTLKVIRSPFTYTRVESQIKPTKE